MGLNRSLLFVLLSFAVVGCSTLKTRDQVREAVRPTGPAIPSTPSAPVISQTVGQPMTSVTVTAPVETPPPSATPEDGRPLGEPVAIPNVTLPTAQIPRIGLILGPGGAKAFAHIGVLHELQREKIPIHSVAGMEWGAPIAAIYSMKGLANEAEWQMSKLKTDEVVKKSLLGTGSAQEVSILGDFLRTNLGRSKAEDGRLPFACPAQNFSKNQIFLMTRGPFDQLLPFCIAYPPLFRAWQGNVSGIREIKAVADHLRARGANTIVLINVLGTPNLSKAWAGPVGSAESILWNEIAATYSRPLLGVNHVVPVAMDDYGLTQFDDRREIQQKGAEKSAPLIRLLARRLGL